MRATIDTTLLATFVEVADASSFSRAARALGTTTATASRNVAKLEDALGTRLFHRTTRRIALTTAGAALYERSATHLRALQNAARELPEQQEEPAGTLKLTAPHDLGVTLLGSVLARFTSRYPKVYIEVVFSTELFDLSAGGFDVALRGDVRKSSNPSAWTVRRLVPRTELSFYASPQYVARRGAPSAAASPGHDWLIARAFRKLLDAPKTFEFRMIADDFLFLREAARSGAGVAMLPAFVAKPLVAVGDLVRVLPNLRITAGGLNLVYPSTRPLPLKISAFRDFLVQTLDNEWVE
jgi:DNA-binding transcriptional LysR family regulator